MYEWGPPCKRLIHWLETIFERSSGSGLEIAVFVAPMTEVFGWVGIRVLFEFSGRMVSSKEKARILPGAPGARVISGRAATQQKWSECLKPHEHRVNICYFFPASCHRISR